MLRCNEQKCPDKKGNSHVIMSIIDNWQEEEIIHIPTLLS